MKRVLIICLVLALIIPALAVCAFAVPPEPDTYVFNYLPEDGILFCEGGIPDGVYTLKYVVPEFVFPSVSPVSLVFESSPDPELSGVRLAFFSVSFEGLPNSLLDCRIYTGDFGSILLDSHGRPFGDERVCFVLERLEGDSSDNLSSFITSDMLQGVLSPIVSLLPVCLAVLVGYIAIRKGLSWLIRLVSNA